MRKSFHNLASALLLFLIICTPSCYSTTAVLGTPVRQVADILEERETARDQLEKNKEQVARLSEITENHLYKEVGGIPEYRIGPLDVLEINTYVADKVTATMVTVNGRGEISYSFLDDLTISGLTPSEVEDLLRNKLLSYVRKPRIKVLVKEFNSKNAMVIGEFSTLRATTFGKGATGRINLTGKTTLMDLIAFAGGYTINADIKNAKLIRGGKSYLINLYDIIEKGDESQNVIINHGDVLNIPELPAYGERVYVMGEVVGQGIYPLKDAQDLLAAISLAGSFTRLAKEENTLVVRGYEQGKKPLVMMADLNALLRKADLSQNIRLKDGDLVYVPRKLIGDINDWIINTTPLLDILLYPYEFEYRYFLRKYLHIDGH